MNDEVRTVYSQISSTGKKIDVKNPTLVQNSTNSYIVLLSEKFFSSVNVNFKLPNNKLSPDYHMIYKGFNSEKNSYEYSFRIPQSVTSFIMPNPTAKVEVSFVCWEDDEYNYLRGTTVAGSLITFNRSNNADVVDQSYNGVDIQNLWNYVGNMNKKIESLNNEIEELRLLINKGE